MKILCIGDIVGLPGRDAVMKLLPSMKKEFAVDFVIANAENSSGGRGVTEKIAEALFESGCDALTLGDHVWDKLEVKEYLNNKSKNIIRPANFPSEAPGRGWCIVKTAHDKKVAVINLIGRVFMKHNVDCPFKMLKNILAEVHKQTSIIIVDMHAETTSEKVAMGHFANGEVSAVFGTHTHIQTADEKILSKGTAYITDLGMSGPYDSVIGQNKDFIIQRFLTTVPMKFEVATDDVKICGVLITVDEKTGKASDIQRIQRSA